MLFLISVASLYPARGYIVDSINGNDNNDGETINDPFKTITRCVEALKGPGDECQIRAGSYHEVVSVSGLRGSEDSPIKIVGYEDERPIWDGTVTLQPNEWDFDPDTGICSAVIEQDIFALFYKNDMLTPARWPNAKWSDKTVFDNQHWRPDGCCDNSERGLIVDDALSEANLNFTGSMAILNVGSFQSWAREVLHYEPGSNNFTYNDNFGDINFRHQQYYLEAKLELLDGPEEWFYDMNTSKLHLIMPNNTEETNTCPDTDESEDILRGRTLDNVLNINDCHDFIVANITFWASNIIANDPEHHKNITFDSLIFRFPSSSHRMLKSEANPKHTRLEGDDSRVINCTFDGAEGPALQYAGSNILIHNSEFTYNDWAGLGNWATVYGKDKGQPGEISQNTMKFNGVSVDVRLAGPTHSDVIMNDVEGTCWGLIQNDGGTIHVQVKAQNGITISHNWLHDSPKKGIRLDGGGEPVCAMKETGCGSYMGYNVAWNSENKNIYPKGDNHTVTNNVAWDDVDDGKGCTICVESENGVYPNNEHTVVVNNGATQFLDGGGLIENNYESPDVKEQMVDPANNDFRPAPGGAFITPDGGEIIGAYTSGETSLAYWIPGRKLYKTSFPIPHDGVTVSADRSDVICRTGYLAEKHDFYFGESFDEVDAAGKDDDAYQMTLHGTNNIFALPSLEPNKVYYWRVDSHTENRRPGDNVYKGDVWSFSTN